MGNIWSGIIPINYKLLYIKRTSRGRSSLRLVDATREIIRYLARARVLISVFRGVSTSGASKRKIWTFGTVLNRPFTFYTINSLCLGITKEIHRKKPTGWTTLRICKQIDNSATITKRKGLARVNERDVKMPKLVLGDGSS